MGSERGPSRSPRSAGEISISLVLPAFNEEANIVEAVREALAALPNLSAQFEILVVDDGCSDSTAELVEREFSTLDEVRLIRHPRNLGYGAALRTGFSAAKHEFVAFTDADRQFHLGDLGLLLAAIPGHDLACGYRIDRKDHRLRLLYSRSYNRIVRSLLGLKIRDCDCALKIFRRRVLAGIDIETQGFLINAEILSKLKARGASMIEVGVRHRPRVGGESTVSPLHALPVLLGLVGLWWSNGLFPMSGDPIH